MLNKKNKCKQSFRKEETHNRTRDIHTIQDLYPSQWTLHTWLSSSFSFWMYLLSITSLWSCHCVMVLDIICSESKLRKRRTIYWTPTLLLLRYAVTVDFSVSVEIYTFKAKWTRSHMCPVLTVCACVCRALRSEHWPPLNTLNQKEVQLCWPAQACCCLLPSFLPGTQQLSWNM